MYYAKSTDVTQDTSIAGDAGRHVTNIRWVESLCH